MFHRLSDNIFFLFIFMLLFGILLYGAIGFDYTDELCALGLFSTFGIFLFHTPNWSFNKVFLLTIGIFIFYICYSLYIGSNTKTAILADAIVQIKPYLAFFSRYWVRTPIPGPTSRTGRAGQASTVSAMSCATCRSFRKCCPKNFLGLTNFIPQVLNVRIIFVTCKVKHKSLYTD